MTCLTGKLRERLSRSRSPSKDLNQPSSEQANVDMDSKELDKSGLEFKNDLLTPDPPPYSETAQPTTPNIMHVYMTDWKQRSMRIMSAGDSETSNDTSMLYHIELHSTHKPNMTFRRPEPTTPPTATVSDVSSTPTLATADFHALHTYVDITLNNHPIRLSPKSKWKMTDYEYPSATLGSQSQTVTWTSPSPWVVCESTLQDASGNTIARTVPVEWARKKAARLEFTDATSLNQDQIDEVVVTGLTFFYYRYLMQAANASHA